MFPNTVRLRAATEPGFLVVYPEMSSRRALWCSLGLAIRGSCVAAFDTQIGDMWNLANGGHWSKPVLKGCLCISPLQSDSKNGGSSLFEKPLRMGPGCLSQLGVCRKLRS